MALYPGKIIGVKVWPVIHEGIVTDRYHNGEPMVISNSSRAGGVYEEPLSVFRGPYELVSVKQLPAILPVEQVLARARAAIGTPYRWHTWNCEQFVRYAFGFKPESPQLQNFGAALSIMALLAVVARG